MAKDNSSSVASQQSQGTKKNTNSSKPSRSAATSKSNFSAGNIFKLAVLILLIVSMIAVLSGGEVKTFASLLKTLQEVPSVSFDWLAIPEAVLELPDWLAWLNVVINFFGDLIEIIGFFLAGIGQALMIVLYFLRWIFL